MALGIYPVFAPKLRGTKVETLGEALAAALGDLEEIAQESELTPLSAFMDNREPPEDFDGAPEELAEALGPWDEWFEPAAGVAALEALAASVGDHEHGDALADELRDVARVVAAAAKVHGMKFRLELG
ncbi:MAG: hypothetical protein KIT84_36415 [Labilithrix sp.]|nr:hypothetical protein [Labilithrix sp.]MCW5816540.1 hypothetical protein [Labilithrix sp.]